MVAKPSNYYHFKRSFLFVCLLLLLLVGDISLSLAQEEDHQYHNPVDEAPLEEVAEEVPPPQQETPEEVPQEVAAQEVPTEEEVEGVVVQKCERLQVSLNYTQETAPRDLSGVLPVVVQKVNQVLEGVIDVEVEWSGADLHGHVGEHLVQCKVTRLASVVASEAATAASVYTDEFGNEVTSQCFHVPFSISDINECTLSKHNPMRHRCHQSAICINTIGSYECVCSSAAYNLKQYTHLLDDEDIWNNIITQQQNNPWERSLNNTNSNCGSKPTTYNCCKDLPHTQDGKMCRASFQCPTDPCQYKGGNDCSSNAQCIRKSNPYDKPNFICQCSDGLMGNGHKCKVGIDPKPEPKVMFDGVTPTQETIKNNMYCECTKPIIDPCAGFPPCANKNEICTIHSTNKEPICDCKPGFVRYEPFGCVDENPPKLKLLGDIDNDQILRLKQGDIYQEYFVDILDDNKEDYLRSLKITWSKPMRMSGSSTGCILEMGEFHVNYTISTPWTTPPYQRITRRVIIDDIDECTMNITQYQQQCPDLIPKCDIQSGAKCSNTIGSYTCRCPYLTSGDGFQPPIDQQQQREVGGGGGGGVSSSMMKAVEIIPEGYQGGIGCKDTGKPTIRILGPNPKVFRVPPCGGITPKAAIGRSSSGVVVKEHEELRMRQQNQYENDIREIIRASSGAELCATYNNPNPKSIDCYKAFDKTYNDTIDLTHRVIIGDPISKVENNERNKYSKNQFLHWTVPYNVMDDAGNKATTVYRDITIEEIDLNNFEGKIRNEIMSEQQSIIDAAVNRTMKQKEYEITRQVQNQNRRNSKQNCPVCAESQKTKFDPSQCDSYCKSKYDNNGGRPPVCSNNAPTTTNAEASLTTKQKKILSRIEDSLVIRVMLFLEDYFPPSLVPIILACVVGMLILFTLRWMLLVTLYPGSMQTSYDYETGGNNTGMEYNKNIGGGGMIRSEREQMLLNSVTYHHGSDGTPIANGRPDNSSSNYNDIQMITAPGAVTSATKRPPLAPPSASLTQMMSNENKSQGFFLTPTNQNNRVSTGINTGATPGSGGSFFANNNNSSFDRNGSASRNTILSPSSYSSGTSSTNRQRSTPQQQNNNNNNNYMDIYESPSIISPSKRGDGVPLRRQSPYR